MQPGPLFRDFSEINMNNSIDFAFLDSGTGGIPYMLALKSKQPDARCLYLGDTAHFPYGEKSPREVTESAASVIRLIIEKWNPRAIVIACNTISVTALDSLRTLFPDLPIVGTVPAIKLAASVTKNHKIGLLATNATVRHPYCARLISDFASNCQVFSRGDPELIEFVEKKLFTASPEERMEAVKPAVEYFAAGGCDTIILGCTHFTHIAEDIARAAGPKVQVVDSRDGVSNQALRVVENSLPRSPLAQGQKNSGLPADMTFFVTKCTFQEEKEYKTLCAGFNIPWGGLLQ